MVDEANQIANSVIAQALQAAGVREQNIELPPDNGNREPQNPYTPEGAPKGEVKGEPGDSSNVEPEDNQPGEPEPSEPKSEEPSGEKPLSKAEIDEAINQASSRFQSIMDRKINALQAQMTGTVNALNQFFQNQENASLSGLPAEEQVLRRLERLEKGQTPKIEVQTPVEQQPTQFYQTLAAFVDAAGLKIDDKRIDWAPDVSDPQAGLNRFLASVKKALSEDYTKAITDLKNDGNKELQKVRKKTGVDRVSQTGPSGAGSPNLDKLSAFEKIELGFKQAEEAAQQP
jgi:hypothetical protein